MVDLGYGIVALVGYGLAGLTLIFAGLALKDNVRMHRAGVGVDEQGNGPAFYFFLMLALLVVAAVIVTVTRWVLSTF